MLLRSDLKADTNKEALGNERLFYLYVNVLSISGVPGRVDVGFLYIAGEFPRRHPANPLILNE